MYLATDPVGMLKEAGLVGMEEVVGNLAFAPSVEWETGDDLQISALVVVGEEVVSFVGFAQKVLAVQKILYRKYSVRVEVESLVVSWLPSLPGRVAG